MDPLIADLGQRALAQEKLSRPQILSLVEAGLARPYDLLYWANCVRTRFFGNGVKLCSIVAGKSGGCGEDCKWCAQSCSAKALAGKPHRTGTEAILAAAAESAKLGVSCFSVVNSGRRPSAGDVADVAAATQGILAEPRMGIPSCGSALGELDDSQASALYQAGVRRYNHNLETSRRFFPQVVTTHTYDDRLATLQAARKAGMALCCGGIFGLGETWADRVDLALALRDEVRPETTPLNFLNPIPGTALEKNPPLAAAEILAIIAVFRLVLPRVDIKLAGGKEVNLRGLLSWGFYAGATSTIIGNYLTTLGCSPQELIQIFHDMGLEVVRVFAGANA